MMIAAEYLVAHASGHHDFDEVLVGWQPTIAVDELLQHR